ncbi:MAG: hypothetical protein ACREPY_12015 [Rhodanobacteraceae bacterium]
MHDRLDHHRMNQDAALAAAMQALPADTPPRDAWPQLAARLRRRRHVRRVARIALPAALAAGIALVFVWPHVHLHRSAQPPVRIVQPSPAARSTPAADLATLQSRSRQWQAWVARLDREGAPLDGRALATAVGLQDRIGLVDLQLSAARDSTTAAQLWQHRITLLQQLGLLHLQPYTVARQTRATSNTIVM